MSVSVMPSVRGGTMIKIITDERGNAVVDWESYRNSSEIDRLLGLLVQKSIEENPSETQRYKTERDFWYNQWKQLILKGKNNASQTNKNCEQ